MNDKMNTNPQISIILPIYNVEIYLDRCMDTLLKQTMKNIEIIMVDDGSPDKCPEMCDAYALKDDRVKVIHKKNGGLGLARNSGLEVATGEYVAFVDSDDYVTLDMCEKLYKAAKKNDADIVYGGIYYDDTKNKRLSKCVEDETVWKGKDKVKELLLDFIATKPENSKDTIMEVSVWKSLFRRSIFEDNNVRFVSERQFISEDVIFDIDFFQHCNCVVAIPDAVYFYCVNPNSLSKSFRTDRFKKVKEMYYEVCRRLGCIFEESEYQSRCDRFLIARARTNARAIVHHKSVIGKSEMMNAIKMICEDDELNKILKRYPINRLPFKYYLTAFLMKNRMYKLLIFILSR